MSDFPTPPPPPPPSMRNPRGTPPPPPVGNKPASPMGTVPPAMPPAPMPAPMPAPGMPPMMGRPATGPSPFEARLQEMEKHFQQQEEAKKTLESQIMDLQRQLKDEHEKVMIQALKAKEDENLSVRVEQQLREMQDKLRREKYEQELQESRGRAENQLKELERRLAEERETWMAALKNQLKEREGTERQVESDLMRRTQEVERRYQEERNQWSQAMRMKDDEFAQQRRQWEIEMDRLKDLVDEKEEEAEQTRTEAARERRALEQHAQGETRMLQSQVETQIREGAQVKAQMALVQSQLQQAETRLVEETRRFQEKMNLADREMADTRRRYEAAITIKEDEFKRDSLRRDQERTQYWEGVVSQLKTDRDALRSAVMQREEELTRLQVELSEVRRSMEVERSRVATDLERARKATREEVLRDMPEHFKQKMDAERLKWHEQHEQAIAQMKVQVKQAREAQAAANSQVEVEKKRTEQELASLSAKFAQSAGDVKLLEETREALMRQLATYEESAAQERAQWENQTQKFLRQIADAQRQAEMTLGEVRAAAEVKEQQMQEQLQSQQSVIAQREQEMDAMRTKIRDLMQSHAQETGREHEASQVAGRLREAYGQLKEQMNQMEEEQKKMKEDFSVQQTLWKTQQAEKEAAWQAERAKIESTYQAEKAELQKAHAAAEKAAATAALTSLTPPVNPDAVKALGAIKQQMQEMALLLNWLKSVKPSVQKKAA